MRTKYLIIALLLIVLSACTEISEPINKQVIVTSVEARNVSKVNTVRLHAVPAVFIATNRANLAFLLSGTVDKVLVKIGEQVEKNQVLMSLYNPNIDPAVTTNLANLESVKIQIKQAIRDVANLKQLRKSNSASKTTFEHKETELKDLYAKKKSIQAQIDLSQANQQESFIRAPFASTVVSVAKQVGEFVGAGQVVLVVNQADSLEVEVNITKNLWKNLTLNMMVNGIYDNQQVEFNVVEIGQMADAKSHLYKVILQLTTKIKHAIGQQVMVNFGQEYKNVYKMPLEIITDDGINKPYIFTVVDAKAQKSYIKPLYIDGDEIVFSSIDEIHGAMVVKGQSKISPGMPIKVVQQ